MNDEEKAYHEAAHAVVADDFNLTVGTVTIIPDPDSGTGGTMQHEKTEGHTEATIAVAGIAGEVMR